VAGPGGAGLIGGGRGVAGVGGVAGVLPLPVPVSVGGTLGLTADYRVMVLAANGFLREFTGRAGTGVRSTLTLGGDRGNPRVWLALSNDGGAPVRATITDLLDDDEARTVTVRRGQTHREELDVFAHAHGWYDLHVGLDHDPTYRWRFAGHVENGRPSRLRTD
jgi:phospholipase C